MAEHHAGLFDHFPAGGADLCLLHFQPEVRAFPCSFSDTGKHRVAAVATRNSSDELSQNHGLAQPRSTEQASLTTTNKWCQEIDHLDAGLKQFPCWWTVR